MVGLLIFGSLANLLYSMLKIRLGRYSLKFFDAILACIFYITIIGAIFAVHFYY